MPSPEELVQMFNDGQLCKLLAEKFNGQIGFQYPMKDSDTLIVFEDDAAVPAARAIRAAVESHYGGLGYTVDIGPMDDKSAPCFLIRCPGSREVTMLVVITMRYPHDRTHHNLRILCEGLKC